MDIEYMSVRSDNELQQIPQLQEKNLSSSISSTERKKEGFVTVHHDFDILKKMNDQQPHIIAKHHDIVVGYTLCMTTAFGTAIEILKSMFIEIEKSFLRDEKYIVMGQVCIDKEYRNQGIFRQLYQKMKTELGRQYNFLVTEVAADNTRSLNAHQAIGFKTLDIHESNGISWHLMYWSLT